MATHWRKGRLPIRSKDDREPEDDEKMSVKGRENVRVKFWLRESRRVEGERLANEEEICSGLAPRFRAGVWTARQPERSQMHWALLLHTA